MPTETNLIVPPIPKLPKEIRDRFPTAAQEYDDDWEEFRKKLNAIMQRMGAG